MPANIMDGSAFALILFDVGEEIQMDGLHRESGARVTDRALKHSTPEYTGVQRPSAVHGAGEHTLASGEQLRTRIKFYDYGVVSVRFEAPFQGDWNRWIELASRWMATGEFERVAYELARAQIERLGLGSAIIGKSYEQWLSEDYFVFHVSKVPGAPLASDLITHCGHQIAQIVRGENLPLSDDEKNEILQARVSYYPRDLAVIGWQRKTTWAAA
jgi:hypothetical protein